MEERIKKEPATLFLVIQDEAHHSATFSGAANEFMNDSTVRTSPNVVILRVSATPYNLQTALAQTPLENEIHWGDRGSYYGINECVHSNRSASGRKCVDESGVAGYVRTVQSGGCGFHCGFHHNQVNSLQPRHLATANAQATPFSSGALAGVMW